MNTLKTAGLMTFLGVLFILVGSLLGGTTGMVLFFGIALIVNFLAYFFSDKIALRAARARPVEEHELPQVYAIVRRLAAGEQMPMPRIHLIDSPQPNAFATGRNPEHAAVAVTTGILQLMNDEELEGVLAHELAHVRNRDILISTVAAAISMALFMLVRMFMFRSLFGGGRRDNNPLAAIVAIASIVLAPLAAMVIRAAISRSREYQADRSGGEISGKPLALASALQKLEAGTARIPMDVNPAVSQLFIADPLKALGGRRGSGMTRLFATHPPIPDRVRELREMASGQH